MAADAALHPELARIRREYQELYDSVQAGSVSEDEARELLRNITAVDGDGAVWSFDPYTGEFTRALPGLPAQQAAPTMFAPSRLPASGSLSSDPQLDEGPPMPSVGPSAYPQDPDDFAYDAPADPVPGRGRRSAPSLRLLLPDRLRPLLRPLVGLMVVVGLAAFMLSSRQPADPGQGPAPAVPVEEPSSPQGPEEALAPADPVAPPSAPSSPALLPPQVRFDDAGALVPLSQQDVLLLLTALRAAEPGVFYTLSDLWVDAYSLPLLGARAAGWEVAVSEWVIDADGRDRLTVSLSKASFPQQLRWWAFVEPQGGYWLVSELTPLPSP